MFISLGWEAGEPKFGPFHVDLKSMLEGTGPFEVEDAGDRCYRLYHAWDSGETLVWYVDLKKKCPFTGMKSYEKGSHDPTFVIDRIVCDDPLDDARFWFPDVARLGEKFTVIEETEISQARINGDLSRFGEVMALRSYIHHPAYRPSAQLTLGRPVSWDRVNAADEKFKVAFKDLMTVTPEPLERSVVAKPPGR